MDQKIYENPEDHPIIKAARHVILVHEQSLEQLKGGLRLHSHREINGTKHVVDVTEEFTKSANENIANAHALIKRVANELAANGGKLPEPEGVHIEDIHDAARAADAGDVDNLITIGEHERQH